jgi:hypothetical protein
LRQIKRILQERHVMRMRVGGLGAIRTDGGLTISDVPTLMKMIKDTIEPVVHKLGGGGGSHHTIGLPHAGSTHTVVEAFTDTHATDATAEPEMKLTTM